MKIVVAGYFLPTTLLPLPGGSNLPKDKTFRKMMSKNFPKFKKFQAQCWQASQNMCCNDTGNLE